MVRAPLTSVLLPLVALWGCSSADDDESDTRARAAGGATLVGAGGQSVAAGGSPGTGGMSQSEASGGGLATGGLPSSSGGAVAAGGRAAGGGMTDSGGDSSTGGDSSAGGATLATGGSGSGTGVFPESVVTPKIMIVGDSISAGPGCYKGHLYDALTSDGITDFEFVGEYSDDCGSSVRHSAVSCSTATNYTSPQFTMSNCSQGTSFPGVLELMPAHEPDLVLLQLGVNDMWGGNTPIQNVLDSYTTLVAQMRDHNPEVVVVVAQINKINTIDCGSGGYDLSAEELINAVPGWAEDISSEDSPVFVADLWSNSFVDESADCVHPDEAGAARMGENWFNAIVDLLR